MSEVTPSRKTTPAAMPIGIGSFKQPPLVQDKPVYRPGSMNYQKCPSIVNGREVPYHVQDEA